MLKIDSKKGYYNNFNDVTKLNLGNKHKERHTNSPSLSFKGNTNFVLINKVPPIIQKNDEIKHIADILYTLGVKELKIGENIELARLLKKAMYKVKLAGFDIPTRISCESEYFKKNEKILKKQIDGIKNNHIVSIPGAVGWDRINEPILYLNVDRDWKKGNGSSTKASDPRHIIWHEIGHWLHIQNYKNNPELLDYLGNIKLDPYQKEIVKNIIGDLAAEESVVDTIAEIFARLLSENSYNQLHPEIFKIYTQYNGPMPKKTC